MLSCEHHREQLIIPAEQYIAQFVDVPHFLSLCRACPKHNQTWACPEFNFDPLDIWAHYEWLQLTCFALDFTSSQQLIHWEPSILRKEVMDLFAREKRTCLRAMMRSHHEHPGSTVLGAGACELCRTCTRAAGRACRLPQLLVHSLESMGADVEASSRELFNRPIEWSDGTGLPSGYVIIMGLLSHERPAESETPPSSTELLAPTGAAGHNAG